MGASRHTNYYTNSSEVVHHFLYGHDGPLDWGGLISVLIFYVIIALVGVMAAWIKTRFDSLYAGIIIVNNGS